VLLRKLDRENRGRHRATTLAALTVLLCLVLEAPTSLACESWTKVFETASEDVHFAGVLSGRGAEWTAGGIGIIATGTGATHSEQALPGLTVQRFVHGPDSATYAVGSHGTIWRRVAKDEWKIEHQSRPAGTKGKKPNEDLLVAIRIVVREGKSLLLAHGPVGTPSLVRDEQGNWKPIADPILAKQLVSLSIFGPKLELPKTCVADSWRWIDARDGLALCRDGRAFTLLEGKLGPAGKAPKQCELMRNVVRRGGELFASCGEDGRVVKYAAGTWTTVAGIAGVFALAANEECLVAATKRAVWQQCSTTDKKAVSEAPRVP
jgi:hypothetical protein